MKKLIVFIIIFITVYGIFLILTQNDLIIDVPSTTISSNIEPVKTVVTKPAPIINEIPKTQVVRASITEQDGLVPNMFTIKVGVPTRFEITPELDVEGCMSTILIPELYEEPSLVKKGEMIVMEFTPKKEGEYYITCAMGNGWGVINIIK